MKNRNEGVRISVLARVSVRVKRGQQTAQLLLHRSARRPLQSDPPSLEISLNQGSRRTLRTLSDRPLTLAISTVILQTSTTLILISILNLSRATTRLPTCGSLRIPAFITKYVLTSRKNALCPDDVISTSCLRRIVGPLRICTIKVPIQSRHIHANST